MSNSLQVIFILNYGNKDFAIRIFKILGRKLRLSAINLLSIPEKNIFGHLEVIFF